jgi:CheY-like chemotaxis protein
VHGIVQHAGGGIRVDSAPGLGTTFTILLPAVDTTAAPLAPVTAPAAAPEATATILVVEDETPVRTIVRRTLERQGYQVLEARHGADSLLLWRRHRERVDAVITDMRMPEMGGEELVKQLRAERADLPVVFVSGYAEESSAALVRRGDRFVEKPFTTDVLLSALADVLRAQHRSGD